MSESRSNVVSLLRTELAEEMTAGFPRLKRIPQTEIIWILDYLAALAALEQEAVLDGMARLSARSFFRDGGPRELQDLQTQYPAFGRLWAAKQAVGYGPGYRYTDVKMLSLVARDKESGGLEGWVKNLEASALARQPRADLLPDLSYLKSPKAPSLRKLVEPVLKRLFSPEKKSQAGGSCKYEGHLEGTNTWPLPVGW